MLTPKIRRSIYLVMAVAALVLGSLQVGYSSVNAPSPGWLVVAMAVYAYLAGGSGILAVLNTPVEGAPLAGGENVADLSNPPHDDGLGSSPLTVEIDGGAVGRMVSRDRESKR